MTSRYLEAEAARHEAAYLKESFGREPLAKPPTLGRVTQARVTQAVLVHEPESLPCHPGLRAPRVMDNAADFYANESDFRCGTCNMILDAPRHGDV